MADTLGKKISELEATTDLQGLYTIGTNKNTESKKVSLQFLKEAADYANAQGDYAKGVGDNVAGNTGISDYPVFNPAVQYAAGSVVNYSGRLYRFTRIHAAGAWVGTDAELTSINEEAQLKLTELESEVGKSNSVSATEGVRYDNIVPFKANAGDTIFITLQGEKGVLDGGQAIVDKNGVMTVVGVLNAGDKIKVALDAPITYVQYSRSAVNVKGSGDFSLEVVLSNALSSNISEIEENISEIEENISEIEENISEIEEAISEIQIRNFNKVLVGEGQNYVSVNLYGLVPNHKYKVYSSSLDCFYAEDETKPFFLIASYKGETRSVITSLYKGDVFPSNGLSFSLDADADYIEIGCRAIKGKEVNFIVEDITDTYLLSLESRPIKYWDSLPIFLASDNTYQTSSDFQSVFIPCKGKKNYRIKSNSNMSIFAFVKNKIISSAPLYADGSSRTLIRNGEIIVGNIPSDAEYMYLAIYGNGISFLPPQLKLDYVDYINGSSIFISKKFEREVDFIEKSPCFLATDNTWFVDSAYKSIFIPCNGGESYKFIASQSNNAVIAFLKNNTFSNGGVAEFASNSSRLLMWAGETKQGILPNDAKYIFVSIEVNAASWSPKHIFIGGHDYMSSYDDIAAEVLNNATQISGIKDAIEGIVPSVIEVNAADYDNLRVCLSSIYPSDKKRYIVNIPEGVYDIKSYFTTAEIENSGFFGLFVPNYVTLRGIGRKEHTILKWHNEDSDRSERIAVLNLRNVCSLETLTISGRNIRYAVHDDFAERNMPDEKTMFNIDVNIYNGVYNAAWGAGQKGNQKAIFESCNFYTDKNEKAWSSHNNVNINRPSYIHFKNCSFKNEGGRESFGLSTLSKDVISLTYVSIENCHIDNFIKIKEENASEYGSGMLYQIVGFGNNIGNADVQIEVSDGVDYSSRIKLTKYS